MIRIEVVVWVRPGSKWQINFLMSFVTIEHVPVRFFNQNVMENLSERRKAYPFGGPVQFFILLVIFIGNKE